MTLTERKEGRRGLATIEDGIEDSVDAREDYLEKHQRGLIKATRNDTDNTIANRMTITKKQRWEEKQLWTF